MTIEIKAPTLPESVPDGTIATWYKKVGDAVSRDELLVDIETDKVVIEVVAPADGVLKDILKDVGETIVSNQAIANIQPGSAKQEKESAPESVPAMDAVEQKSAEVVETIVSPAAKKLIEENDLNTDQISGSGKGGRVTKEDVLSTLEATQQTANVPGVSSSATTPGGRIEERVPMSRLRAKVAERLLMATQTTAMLTTFNEVNMKPVMDIRSRYKEEFEKAHDGVRLGFMSFFVRACTEALKRYPAVNASIDGSEIVYHGYQDIGVAVSSPRGLVVPVLRNADNMSLAQLEKEIRAYGVKARDGKLSIDDLDGGTFTISNGGVFGSLLSTPILNPPQTAILGMHKIQERPMAVEGEVKVLPMMYLALSYDHQMIDGKEAVQFLVTVKELLEDPTRLLLEI
ncbi:MAG: 2-oxoglutarate dehydrogenase complex dihydrolipoyllysine-residue succinyltransferase [Gammaproteobacteria bacterium]|jgi:2-oxoglutarate dehydrogenase E2 component (dihydrolipoamide succinyltransferase)|nr:2-oxoglutarate dehydrogenase complex dihydrolipoyllysine-residue succinyltransferase [Gammaproteobacteria bacterium]MBT3858869.1 2-oxoglutarate dehydrogenase complex dihydrolipoyllysine-residue succinyltransferase [Gammaproteobacteria bacterium]MBT3986220.1 2-oxoglutarate dehydrogenase complex dihydrolipoyllysine-residue succinyltransferase [Gammaproteobacteria bacterium]MBT4256232.1 2-oxoglutarate dehydrogenase complex dihydrolipoyllysine-residue succinyltransferase [Gammaproteobacteria bact